MSFKNAVAAIAALSTVFALTACDSPEPSPPKQLLIHKFWPRMI